MVSKDKSKISYIVQKGRNNLTLQLLLLYKKKKQRKCAHSAAAKFNRNPFFFIEWICMVHSQKETDILTTIFFTPTKFLLHLAPPCWLSRGIM